MSFIVSAMPARIESCSCVKWSMSVAMTSESVVERKRMPWPLSSSRSSTVFTRLPLCASAMTCSARSSRVRLRVLPARRGAGGGVARVADGDVRR